MATLAFIHDRLSVTVLLFLLAVGVWALWNALRGEGMSGSLWGAMLAANSGRDSSGSGWGGGGSDWGGGGFSGGGGSFGGGGASGDW